MRKVILFATICSFMHTTCLQAQAVFTGRTSGLATLQLPATLVPSYSVKPHQLRSERVASNFKPDSVSLELSSAPGQPLTPTSSTALTYNAQGRIASIRSYTRVGQVTRLNGISNYQYNSWGALTGIEYTAATTASFSYKFEQQFDEKSRLTSQKIYYIVNNQFQLAGGDSLQYIETANQLTEIFDRTYEPQNQQWRPYARYSQLTIDSLSQKPTAFKEEQWDSTSQIWLNTGEFKGLEWDLYYEGLHQIAQLYIQTNEIEYMHLPQFSPLTLPYPSQMVYGFAGGSQFDTLWFYQPTKTSGRVTLVDRFVYMAAARTPYDRVSYSYNSQGLQTAEQLDNWVGFWEDENRKEAIRNGQGHITNSQYSEKPSGMSGLLLIRDFDYVYDSLPSGQLARLNCIDQLSSSSPQPQYRLNFLYNSLNSSVASTTSPSIRMYPNPVTHQLRINGIAEDAKVYCYDLTGRLVFSTELFGEAQLLNFEPYPDGLYVVEVVSKGQRSQSRILKQSR